MSFMGQSMGGAEVLGALDARIAGVVDEFKASAIWTCVSNPETPLDVIKAILREIYWEIHCYQPHTTRAGFTMIGRMTPDERKAMRALLMHKWEEVEHRVWALDGYKALGGDTTRVGNEWQWTSPGAFAVAAVWERQAEVLHPLSYLGAEYLFEELTAQLTKIVTEALQHRALSAAGMRFIVDHATEDVKHANLMRVLIKDLADRHSHLGSQILYSFDCFHQVYPMPLWMDSYRRATTLA